MLQSRRILRAGIVGCALVVGVWHCAAANEPALKRFEFTQPQMGVPFKIILYAPDLAVANRGAEAAFARVAQLNSILSDYDRASELSRLFAASPNPTPVPVSEDLWKVLHSAQTFSRLSHGAFDVTVGPFVGLWRRARRQGVLPTQEQLERVRPFVGHEAIELHARERAVKLTRPHMRLDLGGIAVGYAVDEALRVLREHGITRALVDGSGDIGLGEPPPDARGWRIGIARMDSAEGPPSRYVELSSRAISTSGDLFQFVEIMGVRYSHLVDPRTGLGLTERIAATVVAGDCTTADALATAVSVLGAEQGKLLVASIPGAEVLVVTMRDGVVVEEESPGFSAYVVTPAPTAR